MTRHHGGAEAADQQGDHREDAGFSEHGDTDGQADTEQSLENRPLRPFKMAVHLTRLIDRTAHRPDHHAQGHEPHHDRRGPAATHAAHGRHAKMAVDEDVVERNVQCQRDQAQHHARPGFAQPVTEPAQDAVNRHRGHAAGNPVQIAHARLDQVGGDLHPVQQRFGNHQDPGRAQPGDERQPQGLAHNRADFAMGVGAITLGDFRGGGQQNPRHQQKHRHPHRVAQRHRCQIARPDAPGHHGVDKPHGRRGHLGNDDGKRQGKQGAHFCAHPRRAADRGGSKIRRNSVHKCASSV